MEIKTKFNLGDIGYTLHEGFFMSVEIIDIEIVILKNHDPIIYYVCYDNFGDDTKYKINEKKLFKTGEQLKEDISLKIDELLERKDDIL